MEAKGEKFQDIESFDIVSTTSSQLRSVLDVEKLGPNTESFTVNLGYNDGSSIRVVWLSENDSISISRISTKDETGMQEWHEYDLESSKYTYSRELPEMIVREERTGTEIHMRKFRDVDLEQIQDLAALFVFASTQPKNMFNWRVSAKQKPNGHPIELVERGKRLVEYLNGRDVPEAGENDFPVGILKSRDQ